MNVTACILIHGAPAFFKAGRETVLSVLRHTPFDVFVAHDGSHPLDLPASPRLTLHALQPLPTDAHRARRFLQKFNALAALLPDNRQDAIVLLDADTVVTRRFNAQTVRRALGHAAIGMVEQTGITGSTMSRGDFLDHYTRHTLALLDPDRTPPPLDRFRYFNSGVVIGLRDEWARLVPWALETIRLQAGDHQIGNHMIADQDYFQYWTNTLNPGCCAELPWYWNHCEHWDADFPRPDVLIAHFSNFCNGPTPGTPARMRSLSTTPRWRRRLRGLLGATTVNP